MKKYLLLTLLTMSFYSFGQMKVAQMMTVKSVRRGYPTALTTLLDKINKSTHIKFDVQPVILNSFATDEIFKYPFIYANYADRPDWTLSIKEKEFLKKYLERGGFLYIDAGINSSFLQKNKKAGQHHSFADWKISLDLEQQFQDIFPESEFTPLNNSHEIFHSFYKELPNADILPESVREFVINEKWPDASYATVALTVKDRIAVIATPIIAMGWGKNHLGQWATKISFRIREGEKGLSETLKHAGYLGEKFTATRKDGRTDTLYCQQTSRPEWVEEADGNWRVFKYYNSKEISDYAHDYFSQLGVNIFVFALTH